MAQYALADVELLPPAPDEESPFQDAIPEAPPEFSGMMTPLPGPRSPLPGPIAPQPDALALQQDSLVPQPDPLLPRPDRLAPQPDSLVPPPDSLAPQPAPSLFDESFPPPAQNFGYVPRSAPHTWVVVATYAWLPMMHGSVTAFGQTRAVDFDINNVADRVRDANGAMQFHVEGGRGRWGAILDTTILKLTPTLVVPGGHDNLDLRQTFVEFLGMYRLVDVSTGWSTNQNLSVDFLLGGRYYEMKNGINFVPLSPALHTVPLEQTQSWVDLVVGARARVPLTPFLDGFARGDFGGFGMGTSSTAAWNVMAGLDCRLCRCWTFQAGYRVFDIDKSQGRGATAFAVDTQLQGPFIALTVRL
jgi:hypothetical protein